MKQDKNYFRAKRETSENISDWVYGHVYPHREKDGYEDWLLKDADKNGNVSYIIDTDTVCQYTGMKDIHGNMIFEGDIIKYTDDSTDCPIPSYKEGCITDVKYEMASFYPLNEFETVNIEVIGNVFDSPELLDSN